MMRWKKFFYASILSLAAAGCAIDDQKNATFVFGGDSGNSVLWHGKPLIEDDSLSFYPDEKISSKIEKSKTSSIDGWKVSNGWSENPDLPFRREIGILQDGSEIELNFKANQPAYHQKKNLDSFGYTFKVPLDSVKGAKYTAITGRSSKPQTVNGELTDKTSNGNLVSGARYLAFEGNGKKIVFDLGPEGVGTFSDYGPNTIQTMWNVEKTPTHLLFSFGARNTDFGGMISSKVRIYEAGAADDYMSRHACQKYSYYDALPVEKAFCFGAPKHGKNYTDANLNKYSAEQGFGWLDTAGIKIDSALDSGAVYTAVTGSGKKTFRCDLKRPGLYIFTLRCAGYAKERGAFSITANEQTIAKKLQIAPYMLKNITWSQWVENGALDLTFDGDNWAVSSLGAQMLQHSCEDFKFRRGFWLAKGLFEPHPLNSSACFEAPPKYAVAISEIELPKEPVKEPEKTPEIPKGGICLPSPDSPQMAWRYNTIIGSIGPSNNGTFTEFDTLALIERRLKEIKESGINTLLLNGLLSRHTFNSQLDRVEKTITEIVKTGHKNGMKILDHQDLTLLWNMGEGFRIMCSRIGEMQTSIDGNLPLRGFCLNNKEFNETYFKWIVDFIKKTDLDGIMIDEATFYTAEFCGCPDCRRKFTEDTGLVLPFDETSPILFNKESSLWKAWLQWRMKATGDWSLQLRCRIMPFKPYFTVMRYTTHYGFSDAWSPIEHGSELAEAARSCDFLGTEIMSRNVMASNRAVFAFRKAKNALRTAFGCPIFGLVYPLESSDFAYFGWAMNNMNAQLTWMISGRRDNKNIYIGFKDNFNLKYAKAVSEIGLLYSIQSRNWARYMATTSDMLGTSQALTDRHIMHDFFLERSMTPEFLMKYRAVMLNSACALDDEQIETLLAYAQSGGTLFLSATTATLDQLGTPRKVWPFASLLGVNTVGGNNLKITPYPSIRFMGKETVKYSKGIVNLAVDKNNPPEVLAEVLDKNGKVVQPLIVARKYGKGRIIYCAAQLGGANYEAEKSYNGKWEFVMDKDVNEFFHKTIRDIMLENKALSFEAPAIPEKVIASVYRQTVDGKTTATAHLLNATGVNMQPGQIIPGLPAPPAWPELKEDAVFEISLPKLAKAQVASPEWQGFKPVKSESLGNNRFRITVPKELIKSYAIVFLEQ